METAMEGKPPLGHPMCSAAGVMLNPTKTKNGARLDFASRRAIRNSQNEKVVFGGISGISLAIWLRRRSNCVVDH